MVFRGRKELQRNQRERHNSRSSKPCQDQENAKHHLFPSHHVAKGRRNYALEDQVSGGRKSCVVKIVSHMEQMARCCSLLDSCAVKSRSAPFFAVSAVCYAQSLDSAAQENAVVLSPRKSSYLFDCGRGGQTNGQNNQVRQL